MSEKTKYVKIDSSLHEQLKALAWLKDVSMTEIANGAIREVIKGQDGIQELLEEKQEIERRLKKLYGKS